MKQTLALLTLAASLALTSAKGQTTQLDDYGRYFATPVILTNTIFVTNEPPILSGPVTEVLNFLSFGSNYFVVPFGIYDEGSKSAGGGIAVGYKLSDFVAPILRFDYLRNEVFMPSLSLQLQAPLTLFGKLTVIPFAFAGAATPLAGKGAQNGDGVTMLGIGGAVRVSSRFDLVADWEQWRGAGFTGNQYRFGVLYKF